MHQITNPFQACKDIFLKPNPVFAALREQHNWSWIPFFIVVVFGALPIYVYFNAVDFDWYRELLIQMEYSDVSPAEQNILRDNIAQSNIFSFSLVGVVLGFIIINAVFALYLNLVTKIDEENLHGYTDWYGFGWWTFLPTLVGSVISLMLILLADNSGQIPPEILSPTSLAYIFAIPMDSDWHGLAQSIRLEAFWSMYLVAVGISQWTKIPAKTAGLIAIAPSAVIWSVWLMIILV